MKIKSEEATALFAHVSNSFSVTVHAPYREAAPLFGPNGERAWSDGSWNPVFFYPQPAQDVPGAVFAIQHGAVKAIWVNTAFDIEARHFQYVYFLPGTLVTTIDVTFVPVDDRNTKVTVVYARTALDPAANDHVKELGEHDSRSGKHWEAAIDEYLRNRRR
jgi:hypothetical protein